MNKETARSLFMDYLYDELDPDKRKELEQFIGSHPELRKELEELEGVRAVLQQLPVQDPNDNLHFMEPDAPAYPSSWMRSLGQSRLMKTALAAAACILLFFSFGALSKMNLSIGSEGFELAFGEQAPVQQGFTPEQVKYLLEQVKEDNARLVTQVVEEAQMQQEEQMQKALLNFANYMEQQRNTDLKLISNDLNSLEQSYYNRFRETDLVLGEIIQTVSTRN